jgi:hypothetical protein
MEVIEHLDAARLGVFERVLFGYARPRVIVLTTPNRDYNAVYERLAEDEMRHGDHRFEWTRAEFSSWAEAAAAKYGYKAEISGVGEANGEYGFPTQIGVFELCE